MLGQKAALMPPPEELRLDESQLSSAHEKRQRLDEILGKMGSLLVAFSGGVDSTFLLTAAVIALQGR
ncbi:MAG: hypothetical protein HZB21_06075, partial [Deltaproteobacteria bacterium]|nr:hypothetical protein [Deltaproteobacteria bacterium]